MANPTYKEFVKTHGGKSTARLAGSWRKRFGDDETSLNARDSRGAMEPQSGNPGLMPTPPIGGAPPTPPDRTGDIPDMQPPQEPQPAPNQAPSSISDAVSGFVTGQGAPIGGSLPETPQEAVPPGPNAEQALQLGAQEGNPEIDELLKKFGQAF